MSPLCVFDYNNDPAEHVLLKMSQNLGQGTGQSPYVFSYNQTPLPAYNTRNQDHWGYYNGTNYFDDNPGPYDKTIVNDYYDSRSPDETLMKAGVLEQITYPTGGTTTFDSSPRLFFSGYQVPLLVESVTGNPIAEG